jgi:alpha-tubulin suppressor-like RCC1 family protein
MYVCVLRGILPSFLPSLSLVVYVGANRAGQLCLQELGDIAGPRPVPALRSLGDARKVAQIACGRSHTLLLQTDGLVQAFGAENGTF